jgi:hypothetical protein
VKRGAHALHVVEYRQRVKVARRSLQFVGRAILVQYDVSGVHHENGEGDVCTVPLLRPGLVSRASNHAAVPYPVQQPALPDV